jgi:GTPase SAR1 family protein
MDFAGQREYDTTHYSFVSSVSLCLLVVDLHKYDTSWEFFKKTVQYHIDKVQTISPGCLFLIVGTKADLVDGSEREIKLKDIHEKIALFESFNSNNLEDLNILTRGNEYRKIQGLLINRPKFLDSVITSSMKTDSNPSHNQLGIAELFRNLSDIARIRGVQLSDNQQRYSEALCEHGMNEDPSLQRVSLDEATKIASRFGLQYSDLDILNGIGYIFWRKEHPKLRNTIFTSVEKLFTFAKQLSRHDLLDEFKIVAEGETWHSSL